MKTENESMYELSLLFHNLEHADFNNKYSVQVIKDQIMKCISLDRVYMTHFKDNMFQISIHIPDDLMEYKEEIGKYINKIHKDNMNYLFMRLYQRKLKGNDPDVIEDMKMEELDERYPKLF